MTTAGLPRLATGETSAGRRHAARTTFAVVMMTIAAARHHLWTIGG
jgi:hypothetical protein